MASAKPQITLYEFWESTWANVPKLAVSELGYGKDDVKWVSIDILKGDNFDPEFLKINPNGTLPALDVDGRIFIDSISSTKEIIRLAPAPPKRNVETDIIDAVHDASVDTGRTQTLSVNDADRKVKSGNIIRQFFDARQTALTSHRKNAPSSLQGFFDEKMEANQALCDFYGGTPDRATCDDHYALTNQLWAAVGQVLRGPFQDALKKSDGPFVAGSSPGEADFHMITWLARTVSNAGAAPNSASSIAFPILQERIGGPPLDPIVAAYWDNWIVRPSFKTNTVD